MTILEQELRYLQFKYDSSTERCLARYREFLQIYAPEELRTDLGRAEFLIFMSDLLNGNNRNLEPDAIHEALSGAFPIFSCISLLSGAPATSHDNGPLSLEDALHVNPCQIGLNKLDKFAKKLKTMAELAAEVGDSNQVSAIEEKYHQFLYDFGLLHTKKTEKKPGIIGRLFGRGDITITEKGLSPEDKKYFADLEQRAGQKCELNRKKNMSVELKKEYFQNGGNIEHYVDVIAENYQEKNVSELREELKEGRVKELSRRINDFISVPQENYELDDLKKLKGIAEETQSWIEDNGHNPLIISLSKFIPIALMNVHLGIYRNDTLRPKIRKSHLEKAQDVIYAAAEFFAENKNPMAAADFSELYRQLSMHYMTELEETEETINSQIDRIKNYF